MSWWDSWANPAERVVVLVAVMACSLAACDSGSSSTDETAGTAESTAAAGDEGAGGDDEVGAVTIELQPPEGESAADLASLMGVLIDHYPGAQPASVSTAGTIVVVVDDITNTDANTLAASLQRSDLASIRPVVGHDDCGIESDAEMLEGPDTTSLCVATRGVDNPFEPGSISIVGQNALTVAVRHDRRDEVAELAQHCFNADLACPPSDAGGRFGRLAIVIDSRVVVAAAVTVPDLPPEFTITGAFTMSDITDLAATLRSRSTEGFDVVNVTWRPNDE